MSKLAKVEIKSVYGSEKIYPRNLTAETLAEIAGTKTLTPRTVGLAKQLGIQFEIVNQSTLTAICA